MRLCRNYVLLPVLLALALAACGEKPPGKRYPMQGEIKALNDILNRTVYQHEGEGGTIVVPGHGYVSDEHEVVEYRDMVAIIRDRVLAMIAKGATLEQVKAARPTADYDTRYGATTGTWTTDKFIEAVFKDLSRRK